MCHQNLKTNRKKNNSKKKAKSVWSDPARAQIRLPAKQATPRSEPSLPQPATNSDWARSD